MNRRSLATATLSAALGVALAAQAGAQGMKDGNQSMGKAPKMEHCYGVNAVGKNDCAAGAHSCAGQATRARDPKSFVLLPAGVCGKIAGGKTTSA